MYNLLEKDNVKFIKIDEFEKLGYIKHAYSTKIGGISSGEKYAGLNLGFSTEDSSENIRKNYQLFCNAIDINIEDLVLSSQIHEDAIYKASCNDRGKGIVVDSDIKGIDGLITNEKNTALTLFSADCILVMVVDKEKKAIGACHAGWKGTVKAITKKLIERMQEEYGTRPENVIACICPGIGPCCFEVKNDVLIEFEKVFGRDNDIILYAKEDGKANINLWNANRRLLSMAGVKDENIHVIDMCTCCDDEKFYSYRRDGKMTGRMAAVIELI